jgi:hypothetical protein
MTAPHSEHAPEAPLALDVSAPPRARVPRISRRAALALAGATVGVLGVGWLADGLATLPLGPATDGPLTVQVGLYHVTLALRPAPPHAGLPCRVTLTVRGADGASLSGLEVEVAATMTEMGMLLPAVRAVEQPDHESYGCSIVFAMSGAWQVRAQVILPTGAPFAAPFAVVVR